MNIVLWIIQGLVALAFLLAGFIKAFMPLEMVKKNMPFARVVAAPFVRFIGVAEILGAIGIILPAVTGILPWLTLAAAVGLVVVMVGAAVFHASRREYSSIGVNVMLLLLAAFILIGRLVLAPV